MVAAKYVVRFTEEERDQTTQMVRRGVAPARQITRARVLLKGDEGWDDGAIPNALDIGVSTVWRTRKRCVEEDLESALHERPRLGARPKLDGKQEAHLIAVACSTPLEGHARWTLRLLAGKVVELGFAEEYSYEAVRRVLKKRAEALAEDRMVHSGGQRRVRGVYGGRAGRV